MRQTCEAHFQIIWLFASFYRDEILFIYKKTATYITMLLNFLPEVNFLPVVYHMTHMEVKGTPWL